MPKRALFAIAFAALSLSCAAPPPAEPLSMRVVWGIHGTSTLPAAVTDVEVVTCENAGQSDESCTSNTCSVNAITGMTEMEVPSCRPRAGTDGYGADPVLVRRDLPAGVPLRFELRGKGTGGEVLFVGQAGPFFLGEGERRFVELQMYPVGSSASLEGAGVERFLHTATRLPDGRILIAGGFTRASSVACEGLGEEARCFRLTATDEALAFDPSTGAVEPIRNAMLEARAGHTATLLPDGRVLLAGGAEEAVLAMIPQGAAAANGYRMAIVPFRGSLSEEGAHDSFALFDAFLDPEDDGARAGDLGRGRFLGTAGQGATPGALNQPRFLHAAAAVPSFPHRVLLAGGMGGEASAETWEVFDNQRTGGYGVYTASDNRLATPREMPSAVGIEGRVWIVGGALASDNADLAEIWTSEGDDPNGAVASASATSEFPNAEREADETHPEYALMRPLAARIGDGHALVSGWYGPQCAVGSTSPTFVAEGLTTETCNQPASGSRSFTFEDASGLAAPTQTGSRSFGAVAELGCFKPDQGERYIALTGGIANAIWTPQASIDVFGDAVDDTTRAARRVSGVSGSLAGPRLFHTSTGIPGFGIVTLGGITFTLGLESIIFEDAIEVLFLPRPNFEGC